MLSRGSELPLRPARVLDLDPELGSGLDAEEYAQAHRVCVAGVIDISPGVVRLTRERLGGGDGEIFATIVIEGILCREEAMGSHRMIELLCDGDVLPALPEDPGPDPDPPAAVYTALSGVTLMVLGAPFLHAAARWPSLARAVPERMALQHARLVRQTLSLHLSRAEDRLLLTLWTLAQRCGRVRGDGLLLPVQLTHEALSQVIGARRSTVSLALTSLRSGGQVIVSEKGFLLTDRAREEVEAITGAPPGDPIGPRMALADPAPSRGGTAAAASGPPFVVADDAGPRKPLA